MIGNILKAITRSQLLYAFWQGKASVQMHRCRMGWTSGGNWVLFTLNRFNRLGCIGRICQGVMEESTPDFSLMMCLYEKLGVPPDVSKEDRYIVANRRTALLKCGSPIEFHQNGCVYVGSHKFRQDRRGAVLCELPVGKEFNVYFYDVTLHAEPPGLKEIATPEHLRPARCFEIKTKWDTTRLIAVQEDDSTGAIINKNVRMRLPFKDGAILRRGSLPDECFVMQRALDRCNGSPLSMSMLHRFFELDAQGKPKKFMPFGTNPAREIFGLVL